MAFLLSIKDGIPHLKFPLREENILGRSSECEVQLLDTELSRRHSRIHCEEDGAYLVEDLGSRNGTYLNGALVTEAAVLGDGDVIRLGSHVFSFNPPLDLLGDRDGDKSLYLVSGAEGEVRRACALERSTTEIDSVALLELHDLSCRILAELDLDALLHELIDGIITFFGGHRGFILGVDPQRGSLKPLVIRSDKAAVAMSTTLLERVVRDRTPLLFEDALEDVSFVGARSVVEHGLRSVMVVPLVVAEQVIGVIQIDHRDRGVFDQASLAKLTLLSKSAALALHNASRFDKATRTSAHDSQSSPFVGEDPSVAALLSLVTRAADATTTVLVNGESGTGKELIARLIHDQSPRSNGPWVAINCAAISESLLDSELFGHEKGAFTGASRRKRGCFELADGGTLFLDEVAEMSPGTQAKLLRAIQEGRFCRVGGERPIDVDVRIVAATNRDLRERVGQGQFREDLFFRINVIGLTIPPLRERSADIELLVHRFLGHKSRELGKKPPILSPDARARCQSYGWPGNVRELENTIERLVVLHSGALVTVEHLPAEMRSVPSGKSATPAPGNLPEAVAALEKELVAHALERSGGSKASAARELGISRPTLDKKIKQYGVKA